MGPEEAARKCAPQKGSPGRKRTSAKPQQHRAYASWEDENKENIDPRTRKATATSLGKPKALSPTKANRLQAKVPKIHLCGIQVINTSIGITEEEKKIKNCQN